MSSTAAISRPHVSSPPLHSRPPISSTPAPSGEPRPAPVLSQFHSRLFEEEMKLSRMVDEKTRCTWALEASKPPATVPTAPVDDGAHGGLALLGPSHATIFWMLAAKKDMSRCC